MALYRTDCAIHIGDRLTLSDFTDKYFAILGECDDRWSGACAFRICNNGGLATLEDGYAAIGRT
jgi:hypothetical protein